MTGVGKNSSAIRPLHFYSDCQKIMTIEPKLEEKSFSGEQDKNSLCYLNNQGVVTTTF